MSSLAPYIFVRGEIVPAEKAVLHVSDLAIQRGYGIFDFFKIQDGHPYFLSDYLDRFYASAAVMRLEVPCDRAALTAIIHELIAKNNVPSSGIKMILTGGYSPDGYQPFEPNLVLTQQALTLPTPAQVEQGVKIITHDFVRDIPAVKTINYSMGIWLIEKIMQQQAADVLYHRDGKVSEFPRCNFFIVKHDNTVVTPVGNVLRGITRKNILSLDGKPWRVREGDVSLEDVYGAKEAFLTSTTKRIVPIVQVNDRVIGAGKPGDVSLLLLKGLKALEVEDFERG
ncbi:aminotransferase class IV [Chryseolinea lacunae]|uniref:branched-chain-amino-acid transaminase n=1 Tax=Chryseolinea lacunae TaxID=2801331 RepID=A0ABS1KJG9_9BACT|nr:aminotransferase class IV [Chryseolinea lacunae]MBL0739604.1 aminotransferase class IV [Chryseolinea lacunae]